MISGLLPDPKFSKFYADIAAKGQIGYAEYPWEKLDELDWFRGLKD